MPTAKFGDERFTQIPCFEVETLCERESLCIRDAAQRWVAAITIGIITAVVAYFVDIAKITVADYTSGYCMTNVCRIENSVVSRPCHHFDCPRTLLKTVVTGTIGKATTHYHLRYMWHFQCF